LATLFHVAMRQIIKSTNHRYQKSQNRLLKVCCVVRPLLAPAFQG
jgi:hypothetical protein